jgi:hypothetical protein
LHNDDASVCTTTTKNNNKYFPFKRNKKKKKKRKRKRKKTKNKNKIHTNTHAATTARKATATVVTLDHVSDLILDLETAVIVNAKRPMRALQMLFKLSSSGSSSSSSSRSGDGDGDGDGSISISINNTRIGMVHNQKIDNNDGNDNDGYRYGQRLVVTLLKYIKRCSPQSDEHNLALIVLNNISIPPENKKVCVTIRVFVFFSLSVS